jgi:hypothetical protein
MSDYEILSERATAGRPPQEVLRYGITESALNDEVALFDVLPGIGKSRSIPKAAKVMPMTVLTNLTDNYDQFERWGEEDGVPVEKLPKRDLCPTLRDENPDFSEDPVAKEARAARDDGWSASAIHREFDVPCERGQNTCLYRERLAELDDDGPELLVGHFVQAYNTNYLRNRVAVIDESCFDSYTHGIKNAVEKAETYIDTLDDFPFESVRRPDIGEEEKRDTALAQLEEEGLDPANHRDSIGDFHAKAPLLAYAIFAADRIENDWFVADLPRDRTAAFYRDPHGTIWLFERPDFSHADAVVALDATPCLSDWERVLGGGFEHYRLFDDETRNAYLRDQGYEFVQLNNHVWPISDANVSIHKCEAYLREVRRKHGQRPDLITSTDMLDELEEKGLDHLWRDDLYYGKHRGRNRIEDSELLVVLGSPGRGDGDIQSHAALHGECALPATDDDGERLTGHQLDYQSNVANDHLDTVRRGSVFQAAMRAGRTGDANATVYIATGMVPDWLLTQKRGARLPRGGFDACTRLREESERVVMQVLRVEDDLSGREVGRRADLPKSTALDALNRLREEDLVTKEGEGRATTWRADGLDDANIAGSVVLDRMADIPIKNSIRGSRPFSGRRPRHKPWEKYPEWMHRVQRRVRQRWEREQIRYRRKQIHQ